MQATTFYAGNLQIIYIKYFTLIINTATTYRN